IACDSYGAGAAGNAAASPYTLKVELSDNQPLPNSWVKLGQFTFAPGAAGSVQVREQTVTGKVDASMRGRVVADAIKIVPRIARRCGWVSDSCATRINTASTPVVGVVVKPDSTPNSESNDVDLFVEVPIYASPAPGLINPSPIV